MPVHQSGKPKLTSAVWILIAAICGLLTLAAAAQNPPPVFTPIINTVAGNGTAGYSGDGGPATAAEISGPGNVNLDYAGNYFITDSGNCLIRAVNPAGDISTVAGVTTGAGTGSNCGYSGDGGPATSAMLNGPSSAFVATNGDIYIADANNCLIRKVSGGIITTIAGLTTGAGTSSNCSYSGDGGPATSAKLNSPQDTAVDSSGNVYFADFGNCVVRAINPTPPK